MSDTTIKIADSYSFSSNSPEIEVEAERVCKVIHATETHKVVVLKPLIDKLRITFSGQNVIKHVKGLQAKAYWDQVNERAVSVLKHDIHPDISACSMEGYRIGLRVALGDGAVATFGFKPVKKTQAAVRLELNPSKLTKSSFLKLLDAWDHVEYGNIPLVAHLTSARVTRCDVAFDILNLTLADLIVYCPKVWKMWVCSGMETGIQSIQFYKSSKQKSPFLSPKKRSNVIVYDKEEERRAQGFKPEFGSLAHTRVEFNLEKNCFLPGLLNIQFPAGDWKFCRVATASPPIPISRWRLFLDSARLRGFAEAQELLDESERDALEQAKIGPSGPFFDLLDKSVWSYWDDAFKGLGLVGLIGYAAQDPKALIGTKIWHA